MAMQKALMELAEGSPPRGADPGEVAWRGIELCREGDWNEGLYWLSLAAGAESPGKQLPSLFYAYFGYGMARYQREIREGLKLCRAALEMEFYQPESYYYLARTYLLARDKRSAVATIERGLQVDSTHRQLLELRQERGERRRPVLPFLPRKSLLNRTLGRIRHRLLASRRPRTPEDESS